MQLDLNHSNYQIQPQFSSTNKLNHIILFISLEFLKFWKMQYGHFERIFVNVLVVEYYFFQLNMNWVGKFIEKIIKMNKLCITLRPTSDAPAI